MVKILVIDDDVAICELIEKVLSREGYLVESKQSAKLVSHQDLKEADLILLDIMMPEMDGLTFCKVNREVIDCPILFLTAKTMEQDLINGFLAGGDDYIKKPFSIAELRARVNAHIRRDHRQRHQSLVLGDYRFDLTERCLKMDGTVVPLTKSEYDLCELLAQNRGQVFTLEGLLERVRGYDSESDVSAIRVHIKNIRRKITCKGQCPIDTVWGVGYKWK